MNKCAHPDRCGSDGQSCCHLDCPWQGIDYEALTAERNKLKQRVEELERLDDGLAKALDAVRVEALNGTICSPPETGDALELSKKIKLFDVDAMTCKPCQAMWRKVLKALAAYRKAQEER